MPFNKDIILLLPVMSNTKAYDGSSKHIDINWRIPYGSYCLKPNREVFLSHQTPVYNGHFNYGHNCRPLYSEINTHPIKR